MKRDFLTIRSKQTLKEMLILLVLSAGIGLIFNALAPNGLPLMARSAAVERQEGPSLRSGSENPGAGYSDMRLINRAAAFHYFQSDSAIFLDSRPIEDYRQGHIPGAMAMPIEKLDQQQVAKIPKNRLLITYCSDPGCHLALDLAYALLDFGYGPVLVFNEGLREWRSAGYPVVRSDVESK